MHGVTISAKVVQAGPGRWRHWNAIRMCRVNETKTINKCPSSKARTIVNLHNGRAVIAICYGRFAPQNVCISAYLGEARRASCCISAYLGEARRASCFCFSNESSHLNAKNIYITFLCEATRALLEGDKGDKPGSDLVLLIDWDLVLLNHGERSGEGEGKEEDGGRSLDLTCLLRRLFTTDNLFSWPDWRMFLLASSPRKCYLKGLCIAKKTEPQLKEIECNQS